MEFAKIIRSPSYVRHAYSGLRVHNCWWRIILALHGKPMDGHVHPDTLNLSLVRGFRFYGYLYSSLAAVMLAITPLILLVDISDAWFWSSLLVGSSLFLVCTCQLAFIGSRRYLCEPHAASPLLLTFFVCVMAYLSCFCGVCLALVHFAIPEYDFVSVIAFALLMVFGIGSYFIEILFLASNHPAESVA